MIIAGVLAGLLKWAATMMMLGWGNRIGGAVLGLLLGAILWSAFLTLWVQVFGAGETITSSSLANLLLSFPLPFSLLQGEFGSPGPSL